MKQDAAFDRNASTKTTCQEAGLDVMKKSQKSQRNISRCQVGSTIVLTKEKKKPLPV